MKTQKRDRAFGVALVVVGLALFLNAVDLIRFSAVASGLWLVLAGAGSVVLVKGWTRRSSVLLYVGAFLFVAGVHSFLWTAGVLETDGEGVAAAFFLWLGLASVFMWLPSPHKLDLLIPAFLFGGAGLGYYLWWYDVYRWRDIREFYEGGWPVFLILLGGGIIFRSLRRTSDPLPPG